MNKRQVELTARQQEGRELSRDDEEDQMKLQNSRAFPTYQFRRLWWKHRLGIVGFAVAVLLGLAIAVALSGSQ